MQGNSIRYRLKEPEVDDFKRSGTITESIQLGTKPGAAIRFVLQKSDSKSVTVNFANNTTTVHVPADVAERWTGTSSVGFDAAIDVGDGKFLKILVEKDFECLEAREEDNIGSYPNPKKNC